MPDFQSLGIRSELTQALKSHGLQQPTPIQEQAIPIVMVGDDVIAQAQTGTGKTLAFVLPILERIDPENGAVQALIVTPTRELALQITTEVKKMAAALEGVHVLPVYGGQDVDAQMKKLRGGIHIIVATPGRLLDHMRRGTVDLSTVSMLVLDEADQMLHMGFLPEVETIIRETSPERQTLLFSATMPQQIRSLAQRYMKYPVDIHIQPTRITVEDVKQLVVEVTDRNKQDMLLQLIEQHRPYLAIIFCRTKRRASALNEALQVHGFESDELHGDLTQAKREKVMKRFREAKIQLLVATDVAARGLDVEGVTHVFNYDIPQDVESYIHRIGRTGRAGEKGLAITLVAPKDKPQLDLIEKGISLSIDKKGGTARKESDRDRGGQRGTSSRPQQSRQGGRQQSGRNDNWKQRQAGDRQQGGRNDNYQPRQGGDRQQGGRNENYQPRQGGDRQQGGRNDSYQPRQGGDRQQGGRNENYQPRQGGDRQQGGRNDNWQPRQGGDRQQGGRNDNWQPRQGGDRQQGGRNENYQPRQGGDRQQGGRNENYQPRQGGDRQQGGRNDNWQPRQGGDRQQGGRNDNWQPRQGDRQQSRPSAQQQSSGGGRARSSQGQKSNRPRFK